MVVTRLSSHRYYLLMTAGPMRLPVRMFLLASNQRRKPPCMDIQSRLSGSFALLLHFLRQTKNRLAQIVKRGWGMMFRCRRASAVRRLPVEWSQVAIHKTFKAVDHQSYSSVAFRSLLIVSIRHISSPSHPYLARERSFLNIDLSLILNVCSFWTFSEVACL